jgi:MSHA biogenesis protein MshN
LLALCWFTLNNLNLNTKIAMSLINQMLKDLERRGARETNVGATDTEIITPKLATLSSPQPFPKMELRLPLIKMGGIMVLLAGATYLWMQSTLAQSNNNDMVKVISTAPKPISITRATPATTIEAISTPSATTIVESPPLFETKLSYNPADFQALPKKIQNEKIMANLIPEATSVKEMAPKEPETLVKPDIFVNSPALEQAVKPSSKLTTENITNSKQIRPEQKSDNYYHQALSYLQQGRVAEAQANLTLALEAKPTNQEARQTLAGLLLDNKRYDEARTTLAAGLAIAPEQSDFRMTLARLQIEAGDAMGALNTLEQGLTYAKNNGDYQSFLATLLQRANRHEEAIDHYTAALALNSSSSSSLIGLGISLQAVGKLEKSEEIFKQVQSNTTLSPELSIFVEQRIKQISQRLQN